MNISFAQNLIYLAHFDIHKHESTNCICSYAHTFLNEWQDIGESAYFY